MNVTVTNILKRVLPLKGFCYHSALWVDGAGVEGQAIIEVGLAARRGAKARCGRCGRQAPGYDQPEKARCWQFIALWAIQIYFVYAPRRVECGRCGVRVERLPWASGKLQVCDALRIFLAQWARLLSWQEVATRFQVQWHDVYGAIKWVVRYGLRHRDLSGIRALGSMKSAWQRGNYGLWFTKSTRERVDCCGSAKIARRRPWR